MLANRLIGAGSTTVVPSIRGTTSALKTTSTSGSVSLSVPTHVSGDLLFVAITVNSASFVTSVPAGWTEVIKDTSTAERLGLYYKLAGASEPSTYSWTLAAESALLSFSVRGASAYRTSTISLDTDNTGTVNAVTSYSGGRLIAVVAVDNTGALSSVTNSTYTFGNIVGSGSSGSFTGTANIAVSNESTDGLTSGTSTATISTSNGFAALMLAVSP